MKPLQEYIIESLLDDFDTIADFQDLSIILDDPNFNKNNFNKMKRLFKKAGGGEDYTKEDDKNDTTYFIAYNRGGLNDTSEIIAGIPAKTPTLTRIYFPGYRRVHDLDKSVQVYPNVWAINSNVTTERRFWRNDAGPISIPPKYVPYFGRLIQTAPEWGSKEYFDLNDKKAR